MKILRLCLLALMLFVIASSAAAEMMVPLTVKAGSNLIGLANTYCHRQEDWRRIAEVNNLPAPYIIYKDTTLLVPDKLLLSENVSAVVGAVRGQASLTLVGMAPHPAATGDQVPPEAMIETEKNSYVLLIFPDQRFIRVDAESCLRIDFALRLADGSVKIQTTLERGASLDNVKPQEHRNDSFDCKTPTALTGVRGTEYRLKVNGDTRVETLRGEAYATAQGTTRAVPFGQGLIVHKNQAPSPPCPLPVSPHGFVTTEVYNIQPLRFELPEQPGVAAIRLTISHDERGLSVVERRLGKAGESLSVALPEDGLYYASLTAIDSKGFESPPTPPKVFVLRTLPGPPILTIPEKSYFLTPSVFLSWAAQDVAGYRVVVAKDAAFSQPLYETMVTTPSWKTPDLPLGAYYVRVQSVASDGFQSAWSKNATFTIAEPPKLANNKLTADEAVHLRWNAAQEGVGYDLQVAASPDFSDPLVVATGLRQPEYNLGRQLKPGGYYLRMRVNLPHGSASPWGPTQKITIAPPPMTPAVGIIIGALLLCLIL